jgi:EmrB/QacA subfamily drug resistance transporter
VESRDGAYGPQIRSPQYKTGVLIVYILGLFVQILDATIVNVALPSMADDFGVPVTDVEWIVLGYLLALAIAIPASGWLSDRFGSKRVFIAALALFTVASGLCGAAGSLDQLVFFRVLQGLGAGLITPVGSAILFRAFPAAERAKASAAVVSVAVIAPAIGPALGGIIVDTLSWPWIFFVNLPIGATALVLAAAWLKDGSEAEAGPFDTVGLVLASGGLAALLFGLSQGPDVGWLEPTSGGALLVAALCFGALVAIELRIDAPILELRLFAERLFRTTNLSALFLYAGFLAQIFLFTLYLQDLRGTSATTAGFTQSPQAIGVFVLSNLAGRRLYAQIGPRRMMVVGGTVAGLVTAAFALTDTTTSLVVLASMNFARGLAMGAVFVSIQTAVYAKVSNPDMAKATTLFNAQRQSANALGVAIAASVLAALSPAAFDTAATAAEGLDAYRASFLVAGLLFVPGVLVAMRVRDSDAAATRPGRTVDARR